MAPTSEQALTIANLKSSPSRARIPILSAQACIGFLVPVTHELAENADVIDALYRWRRAQMAAFLTVFSPTPEKTRNYLTAFSLPDPARILFLVADLHGRHVGHVGLCNIAAAGAEIDNVVRGEPVNNRDLMVCAHRTLLQWAFPNLDIPSAYLNVLAHNERALQTYCKVGFREVTQIPLAREEQDDGYRLIPACASNGGRAVASLVRMEIARDAFYREQSR